VGISYALFRDGNNRGAIVGDECGIRALYLPGNKARVINRVMGDFPGAKARRGNLDKAVKMVNGYFAGKKIDFKGLPLSPGIVKGFTASVLTKVRGIPYGKTKSYKWAGSGKARAAGMALGKNPVPVIIPCHRIINSGGGLGGFTPGLAWKRRLLMVEKIKI
jgi:O-6-methylguanine DNA methyltransferase